jgi:hypothetical protein
MAKKFSHQIFSAEVRVRTRWNPYEICGGQSDI